MICRVGSGISEKQTSDLPESWQMLNMHYVEDQCCGGAPPPFEPAPEARSGRERLGSGSGARSRKKIYAPWSVRERFRERSVPDRSRALKNAPGANRAGPGAVRRKKKSAGPENNKKFWIFFLFYKANGPKKLSLSLHWAIWSWSKSIGAKSKCWGARSNCQGARSKPAEVSNLVI